MGDENYKKYQELLEKWHDFSKVYDAIREAYKLGYEEGVKTEKYCKEMRKVENININGDEIPNT